MGIIRLNGRWELLPWLLRTTGLRIETWLKSQSYDEAAKEASTALGWCSPFVNGAEIHEELKQAAEKEFYDWVVNTLRSVFNDERKEVYRRLNKEEAETIRRFVENKS